MDHGIQVDRDFLGIFDGRGPVRITFNDGPVSGLGAFFNYVSNDALSLSIFGLGGVLLESVDVHTSAPISTPNGVNAGAFRGFQRAQADISYLEITGFAAVMDDLQFTTTAAAVPEPAAIATWAFGAICAGIAARRRKSLSSL